MLESKTHMPLGITKELTAKYIGGHKAFPKQTHTQVLILPDRLELVKPSLVVPYISITNIENMDERKISALRVALLGIVGLFWKKKCLYTVVQYNDGLDEQTIVIDFGKQIDEIQPLIYQKMLEARHS